MIQKNLKEIDDDDKRSTLLRHGKNRCIIIGIFCRIIKLFLLVMVFIKRVRGFFL